MLTVLVLIKPLPGARLGTARARCIVCTAKLVDTEVYTSFGKVRESPVEGVARHCVTFLLDYSH